MKKLLSLLVVASCLGLLSHCGPSETVLYAQSLPATVHATWAPNAAGDNVTGYIVVTDNMPPVTVAPTVDATCACIKATITLSSFGSHAVSVSAQNQSLSTDPTSTQTSTPTTISFTLSPAPGTVTGAKVVK